LSVVSRAINIRIYEKTRESKIINNANFWDIAKSLLQVIREKEKS
jgi:hypothetical protein